MIQFNNVTASFNGHNVLENISLQINPGEFVFVVGQTGSGKSTLLRLVYMDVTPVRGNVIVGKFNSETIQKKDKPHLRRTLGVVFQDFKLLEDRSVFENVAFTLHVTGVKASDIKKNVLRALADVGLGHQRNKMPDELSGGESCLDRAYDAAHYERLIDYSKPATPVLRKPDAGWAAELLNTHATAKAIQEPTP